MKYVLSCFMKKRDQSSDSESLTRLTRRLHLFNFVPFFVQPLTLLANQCTSASLPGQGPNSLKKKWKTRNVKGNIQTKTRLNLNRNVKIVT